jgi:predicted transcriptional regulator
MACIAPDGALTPQAKVVLGAMVAPAHLEDVARQTGLPLFRIRASVRELAQAGLLEESGGAYRVTAAGREKL